METVPKELAVQEISGCIASLALQAYTYGQEIKSLREQLAEADNLCRERAKTIERLMQELEKV